MMRMMTTKMAKMTATSRSKEQMPKVIVLTVVKRREHVVVHFFFGTSPNYRMLLEVACLNHGRFKKNKAIFTTTDTSSLQVRTLPLGWNRRAVEMKGIL
jgi:hypothetical protein